jgi:hypothetical protein
MEPAMLKALIAAGIGALALVSVTLLSVGPVNIGPIYIGSFPPQYSQALPPSPILGTLSSVPGAAIMNNDELSFTTTICALKVGGSGVVAVVKTTGKKVCARPN